MYFFLFGLSFMWFFEKPSLLWDDKKLCTLFYQVFHAGFDYIEAPHKQSSIIRPLCRFPFSEGHILWFCPGLPEKLKNIRSMYCL